MGHATGMTISVEGADVDRSKHHMIWVLIPPAPVIRCKSQKKSSWFIGPYAISNSPLFFFCTKFKRQVPEAQDIISCTSLAAARSGRQFPSSIAGLLGQLCLCADTAVYIANLSVGYIHDPPQGIMGGV